MDKEHFYLRNRGTILTFCIIAVFCIIALPQSIMCQDLFTGDANVTVMTDLCNAYAKWFWIPLFFVALFTACTGNDQRKHVGWITIVVMIVLFICAKNIDVIQATLNHMTTWFGGTGTLDAN